MLRLWKREIMLSVMCLKRFSDSVYLLWVIPAEIIRYIIDIYSELLLSLPIKILASNKCTLLCHDNVLYGTGLNSKHQLGSYNSLLSLKRFMAFLSDVVCLSGGSDHSFVLKDNKTVLCCGMNDFGQLGIGDSIFPVPNFRNNDTLKNVIFVKCGPKYTFVYTSDGLFGCGRSWGQLGLGDYTNHFYFEKIKNITDVSIIGCGMKHSIINTKNGLFSCGSNIHGQLGIDVLNRISIFSKIAICNEYLIAISCGHYHNMIIINNDLFGCGANESGQLGTADTEEYYTFQKINIRDVYSVSCGAYHTFVLTKKGLFSCGCNEYGQLGHCDKYDRSIFTKIEFVNIVKNLSNPSYFYDNMMNIKIPDVLYISCGYYQSLIYTKKGLFACGFNLHGH